MRIRFEIGTAPTGSRIVEHRAENFVTQEDGSPFVSVTYTEMDTKMSIFKAVIVLCFAFCCPFFQRPALHDAVSLRS